MDLEIVLFKGRKCYESLFSPAHSRSLSILIAIVVSDARHGMMRALTFCAVAAA